MTGKNSFLMCPGLLKHLHVFVFVKVGCVGKFFFDKTGQAGEICEIT